MICDNTLKIVELNLLETSPDDDAEELRTNLTRSGHFETSTLRKQHRHALRLSGVRPFALYSLRHTFLARLGESGCDAWTLAGIAGHSSIRISLRYVHPSEDVVLDAISRLGGQSIGQSGAAIPQDPKARLLSQ